MIQKLVFVNKITNVINFGFVRWFVNAQTVERSAPKVISRIVLFLVMITHRMFGNIAHHISIAIKSVNVLINVAVNRKESLFVINPQIINVILRFVRIGNK